MPRVPSEAPATPEAAHRPRRPPWVGRRRGATLAVSFGVTLLAFLIRLPGIEQEPNVDELLNVLAARSWAERGELTIVEGARPYERGDLVMRLQARVQGLGDDDLVASRWVSLAFGLAVAAGTAAWAGVGGGAVAAGVAGALVAIDPQLVQLHQTARFYAAVQLFFLLGAGLFVAMLAASGGRRRGVVQVALGALAVLCFYVAVRTHVVTLIGAAFVVAFGALWHLPAGIRWYRGQSARKRWLIGSLLVVIAGAGAAYGFQSGLVARALSLATYVDAWASADADNVRFYYVFLYDQFSALIVLLPLLALLAVRRDRLHGSFTFFVFLGGVVVASLLAWKAERYIAHLLPVLYVGVGLGAVGAWELLRAHVPRLTREAFGTRSRWLSAAMLLAILAAPVLANRALLMTGRLVTRDPSYHFPLMPERTPTVSWRQALPTLMPYAERAEVIASERPPKALYFLGRVDISLQYNAIDRLAPDEAAEGTTHDARFDRPLTRDPDVLRDAWCEGDVLVVNDRVSQEGAFGRSPALPTFLDEEGERIELPRRYGINAYWFPQRTDCVADSTGLP